MKFGNDRLITEPTLRTPLKGRRIALLAHPASVTPDLTHSLDALAACGDLRITAAFGPQHGLRGDKQDNMIESLDFIDSVHCHQRRSVTPELGGRRTRGSTRLGYAGYTG